MEKVISYKALEKKNKKILDIFTKHTNKNGTENFFNEILFENLGCYFH